MKLNNIKKITVCLILLISKHSFAQEPINSPLYNFFRIQDSTFFERGFNQCDMNYLNEHITDDLKFFHDQSGFQNRAVFFENTEKYICSDMEHKPIRKVDPNTLEVFPLYNEGELYGAIQNGVHYFYIREKGKEDKVTGLAKFTSVWILEDYIWKLSEVLSYDHKPLNTN